MVHRFKFCLIFRKRLKTIKLQLLLLHIEYFLIVSELNTWPQYLNSDLTLKDCSFGAVKLAKDGDPDI